MIRDNTQVIPCGWKNRAFLNGFYLTTRAIPAATSATPAA